MNCFMKEFITPILKATKGTQVMSFFTIHEFKEWANTRSDMHLWRVKYYKGLGTSSNEEALEYFGNLRKH